MDFHRYVVLRRPEGDHQHDNERIAPDFNELTEIVEERLPLSVVADLERDPRTVAAAPVMRTRLISPFNAIEDIQADAWGVQAVGAVGGDFDGSGVVIAVLDTGVDAAHPAFAKISIRARDFTSTDAYDHNGHGTHCAGTIFGCDARQRIGVATGVTKALSGKVLDGNGVGSSLMLLDAMQWAASSGANVISMSLGFDVAGDIADQVKSGMPQELAFARGLSSYRKNLRLFDAQMASLRSQREFGRDVLVVAATGNESKRAVDPTFMIPASLPSAAENVLAVGALRRTPDGLSVAEFSNTFPAVVAPGVDITSAWPGGGLKTLSGTSMACPHVTGIAALWWQALGAEANSDSVMSRLLNSADRGALSPGYHHTDVGAGLVRGPSGGAAIFSSGK